MKKKIFKFLFFFGLICFAIGTIAVVSVFVYYSFKVPKHTNLEDYQPSITSRLYSSNGILLKEYADEKRIFTPIENIPNVVKNAFISAEDKNFYKHRGIDPQAIISASIYNVFAYFNKQQFRGGSTITQQVVKNLLLTNERTIERKIKEAILSYRITKDFSKDKILELYLNHIYLGNNAYGVASAALNYFNKSLNEITTEEAALLAAMPKAPGKLNPVNNYDAALARRNWVLERMYKDGYTEKDIHYLYHGSRNANWYGIMTQGLILHPNAIHTGSMFGHGLYFANKARKSTGYSSLAGYSTWARENEEKGYIAVYKVLYSNPRHISKWKRDYTAFNKSRIKPNDALFAHRGADLYNDEIIIYDEKQVTLQYIIEFRK